jgi:hypothetical protein
MALQSWREEKLKYEKQMKGVIDALAKQPNFVPSSSFDTKMEELREFLNY